MKIFLFVGALLFSHLLYAEKQDNIRIEGNQRIESETILSYLDNRQETLDQDVKDLFGTGFFKDVRIHQEGTTRVIKVEENPIINRISFEGNSKLKDDAILQEIRLKPREVLSRSKVQEAQQRILEIYRQMGRYGAKVDPKIIQHSENRVDLVFEIQEGDVAYIRKIRFLGNKIFKDSKLKEQLLSKETRWYRFFAVDDVFDHGRFEGDKNALRKFYADNGYPDFQIISATAELSVDQKDFFVTFKLDEGEKYTFGAIKFQSHLTKIKEEDLRKEVSFKEGDVFSGREIEKTVQKITEFVGNQGYAFVAIEPNVEKDSKEHKAHITFEIKEGPRAYIERINIIGNDRTRDSVILREIPLHEGDPYNSSKIKLAERILKELGYFKTATIETDEGSAPDRVTLIVTVEEQPTGELSLAGGFSTIDGPLANVRIVERNFRGTGQTVHSDFTVAKKRQDIDIGITDPFFLGRPLSASADVFHTRSTRFSAFHHNMTGTNFGLGYKLSDYWIQAWTYSLRHERLDHIATNSSLIMRQQAGNYYTSSLTHTISYDRRDSRVNPTSGYILSLNTTYAGLGGNVDYLRNDIGGNIYASPFEEIVLGLKGNYGFLQKVNRRIRVVDSFMLGADSFRGFEYAGLGPRDKTTRDAFGGTRYWTTTAEMMFPIGLPNEFGVKGAVFSDVGTVWKAGQKSPLMFDDQKMRASVGLGIAWSSPFGPLRIDYAIPVRKQSYDKTQRFLLGFSTRF